MLDDMLKKFVDPYFQPKNVQDPDRTNLFELIYSPGNTVNSKEEVNTRREYNWDDLYISKDVTENFISHRFSNNRDKFLKARQVNSVNRTPRKDRELRKSVTVRDDSSGNKFIKPGPINLYSAYSYPKNNNGSRYQK